MEIANLEVWISTNSNDADAILGAAVIYLNDSVWHEYNSYNDIPDETGRAESGTFRQLYDSLYSYDKYRGFFGFSESVPRNQTIAIRYHLENGTQVGTVKTSPLMVLLKLIKPGYQAPIEEYSDAWPLVMRNIYSLGDSLSYIDNYDIEIRHALTGSKKDSSGDTYLHLMGLDVIDKTGSFVEHGDGKFDANPYIFDKDTGILIFPGLQPFAPVEDSRFQIRAVDRAEFYMTNNKRVQVWESKFTISLLTRN